MMRSTLISAAVAFCICAGGCERSQAETASKGEAARASGAVVQEAASFSAADRARIEARIEDLDGLIMSGNLAASLDVVPPRLFQAIARRAGASEGELRAALRDMIATQTQGITVVSYEMDLAAAPPTKTPDGTRTYLLIPTTNIMQVEGVGRVRAITSTLALKDQGEWYLIRVDDANQIALIREIWPEFAQVDFPTGTTEPI